MRLTELERRALAHALDGIGFAVEIFGSRIDEAARGGDIDLIVFTPGVAADERLRLSLRIAVDFRSMCDEKIDVHVLDPEALTAAERAFWESFAANRCIRTALATASANCGKLEPGA